MSTRLVAEGATLSAQAVSLLAGQIAAAPIRVFSVGAQAARLAIVEGTGAPTQTCRDERDDQQPCFRGLAVRAWLAHGSVLVESADDADGTTTITVTATDAAGQSTSASFPVVSEFVPAASFLRHWRRAWLGGLQDTAD